MLTRKRFLAPSPAADWETSYKNLCKSVSDYLVSLETKNALTISQAQIYADQGLQFPSTQVASSDPNNFDDYQEKQWTPVLTFATPGDQNIVCSTQIGDATKKGREVTANFTIITSTFTHSTSAGDLQITGFPYVASSSSGRFWPVELAQWQGLTKAGYTFLSGRLAAGASLVNFLASGSGQSSGSTVAADWPSGGVVVLIGRVTYFI